MLPYHGREKTTTIKRKGKKIQEKRDPKYKTFYNSNAWKLLKDKKNVGVLGMWQFGGKTNSLRSNQKAGITCDQNYMLIDYPTKIKKMLVEMDILIKQLLQQ